MLTRGIYLAPAQFEALFVSSAHTKEDLDKTITAHRESLESVAHLKGVLHIFYEMLNRGIYLAPAQFEALFVSTAHRGSVAHL